MAADLRDPLAARAVIDAVRPDRIYHLAGQAHVGDSWSNPWETIETNLRAQVNLLDAVVLAGLRPRVLVVGSADEYGPVAPEDLPAPGAVLVVRTLDPRLAPKLPGLQGLVAETGSVLSHLAILARELGVPVAVGVEDAVRRFPPGSHVAVEGDTGEVHVLMAEAS